ncbi:hypothetical protein ACOQFV_30620 [Nocardiopsis changdeensis]|uniref:Uncharacterized protein n=1 Tax=Nocardiopsis changdeensis TaxID=2831969 RepID=A0ABX8BPT0_9ACTN|nr:MULTISPECIES: hypothetical protein [Nocardiopsis]QUX24166.1 hypothetical protein KGD84_07645 [Nocardiopsis changdeensis]QYX34561.1 hypothetical protein K1J57_17105 [Nocardiopsis sp. MT53]
MTVHPYRPMSARFADQHLTEPLLRALDRTGPGGLIIADPASGEYRLTHARYLTTRNREVIVYGLGDLHHGLETYSLILPRERVWPSVTNAADQLAHACLAQDPWEPVRPRPRTALAALRRAMHRDGFALLRRPLFHDRGEVGRLDDVYLDTRDPATVVTVATPYPDPDMPDGAVFTWVTRRGSYLTGWHTPASQRHALPEVIRARVHAHLACDT